MKSNAYNDVVGEGIDMMLRVESDKIRILPDANP